MTRVRGPVAALAVALVGCGAPAAPLPPEPATVNVTMREYAFDYAPGMPGGPLVFQVRNAGRLRHQLVLVRLPADYPTDFNTQLHGSVRRPVENIAVLPPRPPGGSSVFAVDLSAGRYGLLCFVTDGDDVSHALKGMNSEFEIR